MLCEVDCLELSAVLASVDNWRYHVHASVLSEILDILARNYRIRLAWVSRDSNAPADWLGRRAYSIPSLGGTVVDFPSSELDGPDSKGFSFFLYCFAFSFFKLLDEKKAN